jgi:hypothetical protein
LFTRPNPSQLEEDARSAGLTVFSSQGYEYELNCVQVAQETWISSQGIYSGMCAITVVVAYFDVDEAGAC